jgi:two-component system NtrC family response regulator
MAAKVLVVEDDQLFIEYLTDVLREEGHDVSTATTVSKAGEEVQGKDYDLVMLDLFMPDGNGIELFQDMSSGGNAPAVVVLTGHGDPESAESAIRSGASDYLLKPPHANLVKTVVRRALQSRQERKEHMDLGQFERGEFVGESPRMLLCLEVLAKASRCNSNLLITGETGTGKELCARMVHANSERRDKPFVVVDCTNIPSTLAESLLFGHVKGSFTGANEDRDGLFTEAHGGTVFLDEVGDLPPSLQKSLLRVLQERRYRPVGSRHEVTSDFRIIAATNRDLGRMVEKKKFRKDLFYRLQTMHVNLPSLRERQDDIPLLVNYFLPAICKDIGVKTKRPSKDFIEALKSYPWPGNVRELLNALSTAVSNSLHEKVLYPHSLPVDIRVKIVQKGLAKNGSSEPPPSQTAAAEARKQGLIDLESYMPSEHFPQYKEFKERVKPFVDKTYLKRLIDLSDNNIETACSLSGLSRARLYQLFKKNKVYMNK